MNAASKIAASVCILVAMMFVRLPVSEAYTERCAVDKIWNGSACVNIRYQGTTAIVGESIPVSSRAELEEIEKNFIFRSFPDIQDSLFYPTTQALGKAIQDLRLAYFAPDGSDYPRTIEFILPKKAKDEVDTNQSAVGANAVTTLIRHGNVLSNIWANSAPKIHRKAVVSRIIIVNQNVVSDTGGQWEVINDTSYSFWANDKLNGVKGNIPFDIDSRWVIKDVFLELLLANQNNSRHLGTLIDYGMLHEITHHLPIGDNYVYNPGSGHGFTVRQSNGVLAVFPWDKVPFMDNDHMTGPSAPKLTAPSSYHARFFWDLNPKLVRTAQFSPYDVVHVYGHFFAQELNITVQGLSQAGVTGCKYLRPEAVPPDPAVPVTISESTDYMSLQFATGACSLVLSRDQQERAFPGGFLGIIKNGYILPLYIPRNLMETIRWNTSAPVPNRLNLNLQAGTRLGSAFDRYISKLQNKTGSVDMSPDSYTAYFDTLTESQATQKSVVFASIDGEPCNKYIIDYSYQAGSPVPSSSPSMIPCPIASPTPRPTPSQNPRPSPTSSPNPSPSPSYTTENLKSALRIYGNSDSSDGKINMMDVVWVWGRI